MLLEFRMKNYKSFRDEIVFSMEPAPKQKGLDYSILKQRLGRRVYKALSSAVVYGPNAAGKTTIIAAIETLKRIILRGNIKDAEAQDTPNPAAYKLSYIPNSALKETQNTSFGIKFFSNGYLFDYSLEVSLGGFLDPNHSRFIAGESLKVNNLLVFSREKNSILTGAKEDLLSLNCISDAFLENVEVAHDFLESIASDELFLTNRFKQIISPNLYQYIHSWFERRLIVIPRGDRINVSMPPERIPDDSLVVEENLNSAIKIFGSSSSAVGYANVEGKERPVLCTVFDENEEDGKKAVITVDKYESYGTIRFANLFPIISQALQSGSVLVVDEFDASIHPMALINLVGIFHNDEININKAQLVFNTHNPIFLNSAVFRRDEIKFVERDDDGFSVSYSLSDFGTSGLNGVRKGDDYMKNYFINRYGAIKDVDFSDLFQSVITPNQIEIENA